MGVAIRTDADVVAVSFEATVVDVAASVVVSHVGAGNGAVGVRAFRSVPISMASTAWRATAATCTPSASVTTNPTSTRTRSVRDRPAVVEAGLAHRLIHELEPLHTKWTLFACRCGSTRRCWSWKRGQTTEPCRAGLYRLLGRVSMYCSTSSRYQRTACGPSLTGWGNNPKAFCL